MKVTGLVVCFALVACSHSRAIDVSPARFEADPGWLIVRGVPFVRQTSRANCGAAALAMALDYWGRPTTIGDVTAVYPPDPERGMFAGSLRDFARARGLAAFLIRGTRKDLQDQISGGHPVLVGLIRGQGRYRFAHYELVVGLRREGGRILTLDPAAGWRDQLDERFIDEWAAAGQVALILNGTVPARKW